MKLAIITGVSKGLGESVATLFLESGIHVLGISRSSNERLESVAHKNNVKFHHYSCDVGKLDELDDTITKLKICIDSYSPSLLYLINNAAVIEPIDQASLMDNQAILQHFQINTVAPIILMNQLINYTTKMNKTFIGVNITSGAAERAIYGWSAYCSSKASINMYTKTVALEQETLKTGHKIIAFNPGIMDTTMQQTIRTSTKESFKEVEKFKNYKDTNQLRGTEAVGGVLIDILNDEASIENGKIYSIHEYF